jgi:dolichyl-phosphate beta-glucosyltransferase
MPTPNLSIVIPAYNEGKRLGRTLAELFTVLATTSLTYEVTVVDDGSKDDTVQLVQKLSKEYKHLTVVSLPCNQGKGAAVRYGMLISRGDKIMFLDADGSTPANQIMRLYKHCSCIHSNNGVPVVIGSRALPSRDSLVSTVFYRKFLGRLFNLIVNIVALPGIADTQCGFKMFDGRAAQFLFANSVATGFSFDVEILMIAQRAGIAILEIPINWNNVEGSKVNLLYDSIKMLRDVIYFKILHNSVAVYTHYKGNPKFTLSNNLQD